MSEKQADRRTLRTEKAIFEALAELLTEKEISKVTVQELSDMAMINRVTFYNHFLDVYDLYEKLETNVLTEMGMLMLRLQELPTEKILSQLIDYADQNRVLFRLIFSPNSTGQLYVKFSRLFEGVLRQVLAERKHSDIMDPRLEYQSCYRAHACLSVIAKWVHYDFSESKRVILEILSGLDSNTEKYILSK